MFVFSEKLFSDLVQFLAYREIEKILFVRYHYQIFLFVLALKIFGLKYEKIVASQFTFFLANFCRRNSFAFSFVPQSANGSVRKMHTF